MTLTAQLQSSFTKPLVTFNIVLLADTPFRFERSDFLEGHQIFTHSPRTSHSSPFLSACSTPRFPNLSTLMRSPSLAALLLAASALTATSVDAKQSMHLRVRIRTKLAVLYEQCAWEDRAKKCGENLQCVQLDDYYGQCLKTNPGEWEQCGGKSKDGPWSVACVGDGLTCTYYSDDYSQCVKSGTDEDEKPDDQQGKVEEHGQCKWPDGSAQCKKGLQCIEEVQGYGHCVKTAAELWGQCGGKTVHGPWTATCPSGSTCKHWDDWYSQCVTSDIAGDTQTATPTPTPSSGGNKGAVKVWGQCGGDASYTSGKTCESGATCVKHSNWYSQCKPSQLPVGELCAQNDGSANVWKYDHCADGATCQSVSGTESRCKK